MRSKQIAQLLLGCGIRQTPNINLRTHWVPPLRNVLSWTREEVRKEWAEDANTMATQVWLPIRSPGRTKTTRVTSLVTFYCTTARPFAVIHGCTVAHERTKCKP